MHDPRIRITRLCVDEDLRVARSTNNNRPIPAARRAPNDVWRTSRHDPTSVDDHFFRLIEFPRVRCDFVVDGEPPAVRGVVAAAEFIQHEVLAVAQACDGRHSRAVVVCCGRGVVDDRAPVHEVGRDLMRQLLAVVRVPLVGVVRDELLLVDHEEGFPDRGLAVVRNAAAAGGDAGDEGPRLAVVARGVDVDLGLAEVSGERVASAEDGALFEFADSAGEDV